jgi:hypothetical protein
MREHPQRRQDAQEAKENIYIGYKRHIGEMLVFLSQCKKRHTEVTENEKEKAELEKKKPEPACVKLHLQGKEPRCRPQEDTEAQDVAEGQPEQDAVETSAANNDNNDENGDKVPMLPPTIWVGVAEPSS